MKKVLCQSLPDGSMRITCLNEEGETVTEINIGRFSSIHFHLDGGTDSLQVRDPGKAGSRRAGTFRKIKFRETVEVLSILLKLLLFLSEGLLVVHYY